MRIFKIGYTVAVGEPCDGPLSLHLSYEDAMQTLEYKFIMPSAVILRHDMLEKSLPSAIISELPNSGGLCTA